MYFLTILVAVSLLSSAASDSLQTEVSVRDSLNSVTVVADKGLVVSKTDTLTIVPGFSITETLLQSTTLYVGDNGGAAGQKNVNLRCLGSAHTAVYVDGVRVGNVQSGQGDLTNLGAEPFSGAVIDYAQNSIYFTTAKPEFDYGRIVAGQVSLSAGSFGTWNPYGRLDFKLGEKSSLSAGVAALISKGNFQYGDGQTRENNDIGQISCSLDARGLLSGGKWSAKLHYNGSDRGLPGSISWPSTDRQTDRNAYAQGYVENRFSAIYLLAASAKYAFDRMDYISQWTDSRYDQQEAQLNTAHKFKVTSWLDLSLAADFVWDKLSSTSYNAERYSPTAALGAAFRTGRFSADIAIEYNGAIDKEGISRNTFSPSADFRFSIVKTLELTAFGRRAYRVPTFNELYYTGYGNPELKPEDALLSGLGLSFRKNLGKAWIVKASADGFLNFLKDKIISAPSQADPYLWLPYNIGKVLSLGADVSAGFDYAKDFWKFNAGVKYSYQSATDRTPDSETFGEQIPYVAKHAVALNGAASFKGWKLGLCWNLRAGRMDSCGQIPDWNTLDVTFSKDLTFNTCGPLTLFIIGKNLTDCQYESVSGYPMPGISVTGGFNFKF